VFCPPDKNKDYEQYYNRDDNKEPDNLLLLTCRKPVGIMHFHIFQKKILRRKGEKWRNGETVKNQKVKLIFSFLIFSPIPLFSLIFYTLKK